MPSRFGIAIVVPDFILPTKEARAVLPDCYSKQDAIFNVQRAALLVAALATGTVSAFPTALEDRLHQSYRAPLVPGLTDILKLRAPGLLGCALSGAGPSILVFYEQGHAQVCDLVRQVLALHGHSCEILEAPVDERGYTLEEESNA
jgi:homoserine kinase